MHRTAALLVVLAAGVAGCFSIDGTLQADGSARLELRYFLDRHATFSEETRRLTSEHVKVESVRGIGSRQAIAAIRVDDVTKLSSSAAFRNVEVTRSSGGGSESLRVVIRSQYDAAEREAHASRAGEHPEVEGPRLTLALPGPVIEANRQARIDGAQVTWRMSLVEYARAQEVEFTVRYALPGHG
jgi:hypothetical protein